MVEYHHTDGHVVEGYWAQVVVPCSKDCDAKELLGCIGTEPRSTIGFKWRASKESACSVMTTLMYFNLTVEMVAASVSP